jgi:hypothetical protein
MTKKSAPALSLGAIAAGVENGELTWPNCERHEPNHRRDPAVDRCRSLPGKGKTMKPDPNFWDLGRLGSVAWQDLVELEPRLGELLWRARQAGASCLCWADVDRVFPSIRNTLIELVGPSGYYHRHPVLGSTGAYQIAYRMLHEAVAGWVPVLAGSASDAPEAAPTARV